MRELRDIIRNWDTDILEDEDRVYDSKDDINRLINIIPLIGEGIIQMKTSTRNLMINGLPLDGKLYKGTGSISSGVVEVVSEDTDYVYHMAKNGTTQGAWSISSTDSSSISQIPYVREDVLFANTLIKGSGTVTMQFLDKDNSILSEMTTPALTNSYQAFSAKGQLKESVWSFKIIASDDVYFKELMITRSSFPSDYMLSEEELEQLNIINTSDIDANTVAKSHAYQVIGLKNCPPNVSTSGLFINIQKDNFAQVFVPNNDTGIYYRVGVTTNRPNTKWTRLATSDNTYSKEDFTEMRTSDNINLIQDSSMSAGFWKYSKDNASTSSGNIDVARGIAHITGNGNSGTSWAQYQVTNQDYNQPLLQNSEIQYDQEYTASVETSWSEGSDIASNDEMPPSLVVRENYKDGTSKDLIRVKAVDKYGHDKWHKLSGTFKFSENRKNDISFIQVVLMWQGTKGDVYFRRPKLEMASLPSAYIDDTIVSVEPNHNLLQDSRDLLDGWQRNGPKVSLDTTGDMAWYQGMRVQHQFGDWSYYGTTKTPVLENGKYYTVSAYMRGLSEADINMYATILSDKSNSSSINFPLAKHLTGEWKRYSYTFKFDANTQVANTSAIRVEGQGDWASNGGSVYVAGIKLEEGKTATDWSPSIEETIVRYETQNWQKDKITGDDGGLALRINVSGTDSMEEQFLSATGTKTFYLQGGATGNNTGDSLRGILIKDTPAIGNAYGISNKNELWFLKIQDSKLTTWNKVATTVDIESQIKSHYMWIRYAEDDKGKGMTSVPTVDTKYVAILVNKPTAIPSDDPTEYAGHWQLSKGNDGIPGKPGADGKTPYTHVAYADDDKGGGFSQLPDNKAYMGWYSDFTQVNSNDPSQYAWSLIKGDAGVDGTSPINLVINSSNGYQFKNSIINTTFTAILYQDNKEIDSDGTQFAYVWTKTNSDGTADTAWNLAHQTSQKSITITNSDVLRRATFDCTAESLN